MSWRQSLRSKPIEAFMACMIASGPAAKRPPHCKALAGELLLSFKKFGPGLSRRGVLAAGVGLAAGGAGVNAVWAQEDADADMPDAADALQTGAPVPAPNLKFFDVAGRKLSLADYRGAGLVVNVWATWFGPCVAEFPTLAAVAPVLAAAKILVLPISIDMEGLRVVQAFYAAHGVTGLPILLDPDGSATDTLNADGVPITLLVNPSGQAVGRAEGGANWNTARTVELLRRLIGPVKAVSGFQPF